MKRLSTTAAAMTFAAVLSSATPAAAFTCIQSSCPAWCETAPYGLTIASADLGDDTTVSETRRGMDLWAGVSCSSLVTNYTGRSSATAGRGDGQSVVGWIESGWPHDGNAIGVTGPRWNSRNCIIEADMQMNGVNFTWITGSGRGSQVNAFSIVLHEGGHYYGLGHSSDRNATMYFAYTGGIDTMGTDDENGICNLYPGGGGGPTDPPPDCSTTGCPTGQECVSGSCRAMTGDGTVCAPCSNSSECGGANDFCLGYPDGAGYCGSLCNSSADCGDGQCVDVGGVGQCVRIVGGAPSCAGATPAGCTTDSDCAASQTCNTGTGGCVDRPTGGAALGQPCEANEDCNSTLCAALSTGSVCSQSCDGLDAGSCPGGFYCDGEAVGVCGTGLCLAGAAGAGALGAACSADTDCSTLMCDRGTCATPCIPGGATSCATGFTCQTGAAAGCGACKVAGGIGASCESNDDCASSLCATRDGDAGAFCTGICSSAEDCPRSFTCDSAGDFSVCVPPVGTDAPPEPGTVGAACGTGAECNSGLCTTENFCTDICVSGAECPSGYVCESTSDGITRVCTPVARPTSGGGCGCVVPTSGPTSTRGVAFVLLGLAALVWRRRRS